MAGWLLLGDQFQQTLLLVPAWLISEWMDRASVYQGSGVYLARMIAVLAAVYLTAFLHSWRRAVFGILFGVSAVDLCVSVRMLADGWQYYGYGFGRHDWGFLPWHLRVTAFVILLLTVGFGWFVGKQSLVPAGVIVVMAFVLPWAQTVVASDGWNGQTWKREESKVLINYGIAAFALTVMWFYFSSIMDKLGRSLGLIVLGVLFLAGGWLLGTMRRKLVGNIPEDGMTRRNRGAVLLVVQLVLVLSIAGKYLYERKVCPRVWVRTAQIDPNLPFRGRNLALRLVVDACALPHVEGRYIALIEVRCPRCGTGE